MSRCLLLSCPWSHTTSGCRPPPRAGAAKASTRHIWRRGATPTARDPRVQQIAALERQFARATARADRAEAIVEVQKQGSALLAQIHQGDDEPPPPTAEPGRPTGPRA